MPDYIEIAEDSTPLSLKEMQEMQNIIHQSFIETGRQQILQNQIESQATFNEGKLGFHDNSTHLLNAPIE